MLDDDRSGIVFVHGDRISRLISEADCHLPEVLGAGNRGAQRIRLLYNLLVANCGCDRDEREGVASTTSTSVTVTLWWSVVSRNGVAVDSKAVAAI